MVQSTTLLLPYSRLYMSLCNMIAWVIVSGSTAAASSPAGLLVARFMLGLIEAPFYPGAVYFLSCWYTKKELGIRMAFLVSGLLLSNAFAGLISSGVLSGMAGVGNLAAWRWLFILEGLATIATALVALVFLSNYPATTKWLGEEETIGYNGDVDTGFRSHYSNASEPRIHYLLLFLGKFPFRHTCYVVQ